MRRAIRTLKRRNSLPGICGRVCPQGTQCEKFCVLNENKLPVAIGPWSATLADWELRQKEEIEQHIPEPTGKRIAIVGSGPAGLTCAADLAREGHKVIIFASGKEMACTW